MSEVLAVQAHIAALSQIFRPSAPTDDAQLFLGRRKQLSDLTATAHEVGRHAIVFGERGVGKTSIANMARAGFAAQSDMHLALRLACSADDDFGTAWRKLLPRLRAAADARPDMAEPLGRVHDLVEDILLDDPTPDSVARALNAISSSLPLVVVVDEFDRLPAFAVRDAFADLIKTVSDDYLGVTIVMVGVADSVAELLAGHASIDRALRQVHIPRMSAEELSSIVTNGFAVFGERSGVEIRIDPRAVAAIASLSQGFPYYTHLLAGSVGQAAILEDRREITVKHVIAALVVAADEADPSIRDAYAAATGAARSHATYGKTLMACAMSQGDHTGFFAASDISADLSELHQTQKKQSSYHAHLSRFSQEPPFILERKKVKGRYRYRFRNPLMKPFVLMNGYKTGLLSLPQGDSDA